MSLSACEREAYLSAPVCIASGGPHRPLGRTWAATRSSPLLRVPSMSKIEQGKDHRGFFPRMSLSAQRVLTPPRHVGLGAEDPEPVSTACRRTHTPDPHDGESLLISLLLVHSATIRTPAGFA